MIVGFDTATSATAVGLLSMDGQIALAARDDPEPGARPNHATRLLALIDELMRQSGTGWNDVERIAVGIGPGTFTGLRIGVATARALAQATGAELVGISTLHALASAAYDPAAATVMAVLDARRGEVFAAGWRAADLPRAGAPDPAAPTVLPAQALAPEAAAECAAALDPPVLAVGDGAVRFREVLEPSGVSVPGDHSPLHGVCALEHCRLARGVVPARPGDVRPDYLRVPDAELALRARTR